jgi:hypothetical protein
MTIRKDRSLDTSIAARRVGDGNLNALSWVNIVIACIEKGILEDYPSPLGPWQAPRKATSELVL